MANMTFKANLLPDNAGTQKELGSSNARWSIYGDLHGNAETAGTADVANSVTWNNVSDKPTTSISWGSGTTNGPTLTVTAAGSASNAIAIPKATSTNSGIITTAAQTFTGEKTFSDILRVGNSQATTEKAIVVNNSAGNLQFTAVPSSNTRGIYTSAHGTGSEKWVVKIDTNNNVTFNGTANSANYLKAYETRYTTTTLNKTVNYGGAGSMFHLIASSETSATDNGKPPMGDANILQMNWDNNGGFDSQLGIHTYYNRMEFRSKASQKGPWREVVTSTPGVTAGSTTTPIYISTNGVATAIDNLLLTTTDTSEKYVKLENSTGNITLDISSTGNRGIYDGTTDSWMITMNSEDTDHVFIPKTLSISNGLIKSTCNENTVTIGSQNPYYCHFYSQKPFYFSNNIEVDGSFTQYTNSVTSMTWIYGRSTAAVIVPTYNEYHAGLSMKTSDGSWEIGVYQHNNLWFTYVPDTQYTSGQNTGVFQTHMSADGKVWGAVYNDYAEMRNVPEAQIENSSLKPGTCVCEVGDGTMVATTERLQRGCKIISDTFGFNIGETEDCKTPIAVSGRALVYLDQDREIARDYIGWPVCSGPNGTVSIMTEEEEEKYPSRIVGTISEIPNYERWGSSDVEVNGRIWIYVR